ncbi:Glucose/arabinose dehydrogenase, beta-propeller fold [Dyadobacter soli]|uniref:Glucose/arabinose dehydrogenase, beta-propeller fold n=1 Tax=Dyadobacter soli TaxID=659014 RepID=A0A1G7VLG5_9BACT|nr:PQQ-dependent sugar dehydrogenase [Dyadobacter soli]SDG60408.1 Glucose/arabinose dehydrogenase, beta-propeller fold [Dyadobacter soli]
MPIYNSQTKNRCFTALLVTLLLSTTALTSFDRRAEKPSELPNSGLTTPQGFSAIKLIEGIGKVRHLIVTPKGHIYARLARPINGQGTLVLSESDGKAIVKAGFGNYGGTGVHLYNGYLYTSSNSEIFRYKVDENEQVINPDEPEVIVTGLVDKGTHETKSIMMDNSGNMYIPIGCPSNSCQIEDRKKGSMGQPGCPLLETSGGVWKFSPNKLNQTYADGVRYATGLRNVVAVDWNNQTNQLYVMQHGRDQLDNLFPNLYNSKDNAELPAECMYALKSGDNAGWPFIYYDPVKQKKILAPEYGGDGKKEGSSEYIDPVAAFPAHMAPNDILFYTGNQFPSRYKNGAFIAFHGSWNRSPEPQAGYFVVFQPFKNGKPFGKWEVFADGFSGSPEKTASGRADHRPCGLAQGPDGSLYVSDDSKGAIYKITYSKTHSGKPVATASASVPSRKPGKKSPPQSVPAAIRSSYQAGQAIYSKHCLVCHQADGGGVQNLNAPLVRTDYVLGNKNRLIRVILDGMGGVDVNDERYTNVMPSHSFLTDKQIADVLTYVRNSFGNKASAVTPAEVTTARKTHE